MAHSTRRANVMQILAERNNSAESVASTKKKKKKKKKEIKICAQHLTREKFFLFFGYLLHAIYCVRQIFILFLLFRLFRVVQLLQRIVRRSRRWISWIIMAIIHWGIGSSSLVLLSRIYERSCSIGCRVEVVSWYLFSNASILNQYLNWPARRRIFS